MMRSISLILVVLLLSLTQPVWADDWQDFHGEVTVKYLSDYVLSHGIEASGPVIQSILDIYLGNLTLELFHSYSPEQGVNDDYGDEVDFVIMYGHPFDVEGTAVSRVTGLKEIAVLGKFGFYNLIDLTDLEEGNEYFSAIKLTGRFGPVLGLDDLTLYGRFEADTWQKQIVENQYVARLGSTAKLDLPDPCENVDLFAEGNIETVWADGFNPEGGKFELAHISPKVGLSASWRDLTFSLSYKHQEAFGDWIDNQNIVGFSVTKQLW